MLALSAPAFNLNGVQATTHMAAPLLVVNGPIARDIGMNAGANCFGSGNRANATIGRAIRLILLNVGGGWPGELDQATLGHPGKYTYCIAENEAESPFAPYHVDKGFDASDSTVFVFAAEPPHSVTNHVANDPPRDPRLHRAPRCPPSPTTTRSPPAIARSCWAPSTRAPSPGTAGDGQDVRNYLWMNAGNRFGDLAFEHRYGKVYNRNLPVWYRREPDSRIPIVPSPDHIHLFVAGGDARDASPPSSPAGDT